MRYFVYILQSESTQRYYCGFTSDVGRRLSEHNDPDFIAAKTTSRYKGPWELVWFKENSSKTEALKREKWIKKRGIGRFLENPGGG